ncbi:hypothetical protein DY000_02012747 [Brassica cretica]|uniref:Uncharacterized protein n=1 Tax=Brassica cretica TaxID=69181 RepID=A0ABQ7DD92_BRACR|nr:hypothetical protein DY000_02012747 [Brassica cretica]
MNVAERLLGATITLDWEDTITTLLQSARNRLDTVLLRLVFQTSIYVWLTFKETIHWKRLLGATITPDWEDTITTLLQSARNRLDTILLRLVFQTSIYVQWKERRHGSAFVSVDMTTRAIGKLVKNHISSLKYMGNHKPEGLLRRWFEVYPF